MIDMYHSIQRFKGGNNANWPGQKINRYVSRGRGSGCLSHRTLVASEVSLSFFRFFLLLSCPELTAYVTRGSGSAARMEGARNYLSVKTPLGMYDCLAQAFKFLVEKITPRFVGNKFVQQLYCPRIGTFEAGVV